MLQRILRALRPSAPNPGDNVFAQRMIEALRAARRSEEEWSDRVHLTSDYPALANLAAVKRWEVTRLARTLGAAESPPALRRQATDCIRALFLGAEAFHRLTSGYRFSKFERVCEGQTLLEEARALRQRVERQVSQYTGEMRDVQVAG